MGQVSLRDLVQKYTKGEVGKDEYRKTRTDLINNVLAREDTLRTNNYPPLVKPTDEGTLDITERSQKKESGSSPVMTGGSTPSAEKTVPKRGRPLHPMYIAGALILVIIAIIVVVVLLPDHSQEQQATVQNLPVTQETQPAHYVVSAQARTLIQDFLQKNTWDNNSMDEFLLAWHALPETDIQSIKGSLVLNRLRHQPVIPRPM